MRLDHLVFAAQTLEEGREWLEAHLGVALQEGGEHALFGTHNLLLSLGPFAYLEMIAINEAAPKPQRPRWFGLDTKQMQERLKRGPALIHWVVQVPQLPYLQPNSQLHSSQLHSSQLHSSQLHSSKEILEEEILELARGNHRWALTVPPDGSLPLGGVQPSVIAWHTSPPPTRLRDVGVRLEVLRLGTPQLLPLRHFLGNVLQGWNFAGQVELFEAEQPQLQAIFDTPQGSVTF